MAVLTVAFHDQPGHNYRLFADSSHGTGNLPPVEGKGWSKRRPSGNVSKVFVVMADEAGYSYF